MIYFSELKGKKVATEDLVNVGKLEDLIFLASELPHITKLIVICQDGLSLIIPINFLQKINNQIVIKKEYETASLEENELYVLKNLLDKQIIDLKGNKIVRVNDVAIQDKGKPYIAGVDVGILGILRWIKIEKSLNKLLAKFNKQVTSNFLSWADLQPLELARGQVKLKKEEAKLEKIRPEDLADYLEKTNIINTRKVLGILDEKFAAEVIKSLNINYQTALFKYFKPDKAAKFISLLDPDDAVDALLTLSLKKREQILNLLPQNKKNELDYLLRLSINPVGDLLSTEVITVRSEETVRNVIARIKKESVDFRTLISIFVVNSENHLVGVFNLHELLLNDLDTPVYKFMIQNVIIAHLKTPVEIIFRKMLKYRIAIVPIIGQDKKIIGIVSITDSAEYILKKL